MQEMGMSHRAAAEECVRSVRRKEGHSNVVLLEVNAEFRNAGRSCQCCVAAGKREGGKFRGMQEGASKRGWTGRRKRSRAFLLRRDHGSCDALAVYDDLEAGALVESLL